MLISNAGPGCRDAGIVHEPPQSAPGLRDFRHRCVHIGLFGHVEPDRLHVLDLAERREVGILARARVDEVSGRGQMLGEIAADAGAGAGDQHRLHRRRRDGGFGGLT